MGRQRTLVGLFFAISLVSAQIDYGLHLQLVNKLRSDAGVGALQLDGRLNSCADAHSQDMRDRTGLSHTGSDGSSPGDRIKKCVGQSNIFAGENAAEGYNYDQNVITGWFNSDAHRANMLNGNYNALGVGRAGTYWTQNFAGLSGVQQQQPPPQQQSPSPRPQSPSPQPSPSPSPARSPPASTLAVRTATTINRATTRVTARPQATNLVNPFADLPNAPPPETGGIILDNTPGIDSIVPTTYDTSVGDQSGASTNDIDDRIYAGMESEKNKKLAAAAMQNLTAEERAAYEQARLEYGDYFNPFLLNAVGRNSHYGFATLFICIFGVLAAGQVGLLQ
ncbi:hypothetical protein HK098_004294 [Nowakowskiella sp. JEL0407]|nr:hypothetical protein HK098_004294 [Nowakowskiella sp. JEL0407]